MQATTNHQIIFKITIGVLIGIFTLMGYLYLGAQNETLELQKSLTNKVEQLAETEAKLDSIARQLDTQITQIRQLGGNVSELRKIRQQLENDKKKLKYDFSFSAQKYQFKIREYENYLTTKDDDIRQLRAENGTLLSRAKELEAEKQSVINENAGLKTEKEALSQTVASYSAQNDDLKRKVNLGSALKAVDVQVAAVSSGGRERSGGSYKASRIDRLKIAFTLPANPLTAQNTKDIFVRIMDSNGAVLSENGVGGMLYYEGREIGYSIRQAVFYENNDQKVDILYRKDTNYKSGRYTIELYAEGFRIGNGSFEVK
nr:hypothetical protein [uncultured Arsenicibacter sp.]